MSAAALDTDALLERAVVQLVLGDGWPAEDAVEDALEHLKVTGGEASEIGIARARERARQAERERRAAATLARREDTKCAQANASLEVKSKPEPEKPQAPTNEEIIGWIKRLEGNPDTREVRAALHRMRVGAVPFISVEADTLTPAQAKTSEASGRAAAPTGLLRTVDYDPAAIHSAPTWLVKGLFPDRGLGMLVGESQSGKSFLTVHAAICIARGEPFFGRKVKAGGVLYIAAEGGSSVLPRIKAADKAIGGMLADNHILRKGKEPMARAPIKVMTETPNLSRDGDPAALARAIRAIARECEEGGYPLSFVVLDTLHASMCGGDEQSAADTGHALKPLREAAEELGLFVLIVHHPGKDIERGARGSSALRAAVDTEIELRVPGAEGSKAKPAGLMRRATLTKQRDGEVGVTIHYHLNTAQLGQDEDGEPWVTCTVTPCEAPALDAAGKPKGKHAARLHRALKAALSEHGGERAPMSMVRGYFNNAGPADEKEEARRKAFRRTFESLCDAGLIATDSCEQWVWFSKTARDAGQPDTP